MLIVMIIIAAIKITIFDVTVPGDNRTGEKEKKNLKNKEVARMWN